ncbi:MAG: hypothetical protein KIT69_11025 [Propionibacteriaceae bacterium]|nr:hypothetical protein [Propionibacteriaceae bacterium]
MNGVRWHAAIGYALVGEELPLAEPAQPDPARLVSDLVDAGWDAGRIRAHASAAVEAEQPWPHQIPVTLRRGCGAAQLAAALGRTRALLEVVALETRGPSARTALDADEQRLLRDVPPHY